ncbi:MAG: hypothetical protein K8I60_00370 [Anaerolineae bacterium]|nr:hypothetical protein [Anaerolineae bacterium]
MSVIRNEALRDTSDPAVLHNALPLASLSDVIESFEAAFGLSGVVTILDSTGQVYYGPDEPDTANLILEPIEVDHRLIGKVGLPTGMDGVGAPGLRHLGLVLGRLAQETMRQHLMSDEVLERYEELNLVYDLGRSSARRSRWKKSWRRCWSPSMILSGRKQARFTSGMRKNPLLSR